MKDNRQYKTIGQIELGKYIKIADPCYDANCIQGTAEIQIQPGTYDCELVTADLGENIGICNTQIAITLNSVDNTKLKYYPTQYSIYVDSGQAGFFDKNFYLNQKQNNNGDYDEPETFYGSCCEITLNPKNQFAGIIKNKGFVSSSGFGDGTYSLFIATKNNKIVSLILLFIDKKELTNIK